MLGNWLKTSILMAAILALFGVLGAYIGGAPGMLLALLFGGALSFYTYWNSDKMVLCMYNDGGRRGVGAAVLRDDGA